MVSTGESPSGEDAITRVPTENGSLGTKVTSSSKPCSVSSARMRSGSASGCKNRISTMPSSIGWTWVKAPAGWGRSSQGAGLVSGAPEDGPDTSPAPWLLRPQPAGALTQVQPIDDGMVEIRFLHPDADPDRIRAELTEHGFELDVTFVPSDPFSVGTLVMASSPDGDSPVETIHEGIDVTGGGVGHYVGIRVPNGWTGQGHAIAIGRPALPGESFNATVALNAERPSGRAAACARSPGSRAAAPCGR